MQEKKNNLEASWKQRKENALKLANETIEQLLLHKEAVNFNSVHVQSGLSKSYLYQTPEIRKRIEECRQKENAAKAVWHEKYDKTSKSKDVIIAAKDKRIAKLEEENKKLKKEIANLMALLYKK